MHNTNRLLEIKLDSLTNLTYTILDWTPTRLDYIHTTKWEEGIGLDSLPNLTYTVLDWTPTRLDSIHTTKRGLEIC